MNLNNELPYAGTPFNPELHWKNTCFIICFRMTLFGYHLCYMISPVSFQLTNHVCGLSPVSNTILRL